ncbi:hypothetical protein BD289DRAFT_359932 [Coniella lustricola]|uniref:Homeobox and C2H2 transcription factor n=1 Tax=Coniella lustricola TaxID=2025994 RepID=A0A2T3AKS5_9PEZI|nr:hypothetical protein BD289DRAFT_359932 [Coniella lustricola]
MAEFVNWDFTEQPQSQPITGTGTNLDFAPVPSNHDFDLALANVEGDDFSFWALEHFETSHLDPALVLSHVSAGDAAPSAQPLACEACQASGYDCESTNGGSCTTCLTLNLECSLLQQGPGQHSTVTTASPSATALTDYADPQAQKLRQEVRQQNDLRSSSSPDVPFLDNGAAGNEDGNKITALPKIGARFSRESVRILRAWLATHSHRPYPNDEERESLQRQTGLNKTQISNWLANARRRSKTKYQGTRSTSPSVRGFSGAIEIPQKRGTTATEFEYLSPLQRWQNSPPENEPASVTAIASAILQSNQREYSLNSPFSLTDDDAGRSCKGSSASSFGTSPSSASFASAYSHGSRGSLGSFEHRGRRRRRRRIVPNGEAEKGSLIAPPKTFQCTFCTESFRTKHDWQRHEKSLHLSLERWVCSPHGSKAINPETQQLSCVFCGIANPSTEHIEGHNHTACQEKPLNERTFYRKDHLRQHLKLVHNVKYLNWSMDSWKVPSPDIQSRCGFCDALLPNWPSRVDHLAEHFKTGYDMRSWKGEWGFSSAVRAMVENAIPAFMIHTERTTPLPYRAGSEGSKSPRNAYELIKAELLYALYEHRTPEDVVPSDDEMQYEACRIIYAAGNPDSNECTPKVSWLRDLLLSAEDLSMRARMGPLRTHLENFWPHLEIKGKLNIWQDCPMDKQLADFVQARRLLNLPVTKRELQIEACNIVGRMEDCSTAPSDEFANFILRLILKCPRWLKLFCYGHGVIPVEEPLHEASLSPLKASTRDFSRLERELADFIRNYRATRSTGPSDDDIRKYARCIVYKCQDAWQSTAADVASWLTSFKDRHSQIPSPPLGAGVSGSPPTNDVLHLNSDMNKVAGLLGATGSLDNCLDAAKTASPNLGARSTLTDSQILINGVGGYRRLARDLTRFVVAAMSANNPNCHVPTDQELQHQARWIMYDDDDPFNHTAADNAEWLLQFKRSVGILPESNDTTLPNSWNVDDTQMTSPTLRRQGSTMTFTVPATTAAMVPLSHADLMQIDDGPFGTLTFDTAELQNSRNLPQPGAIFGSRDFEDKLVQFAVAEIASSGRMPADEAIQARAKEISGFEVWQTQTTSADDPALLSKFKELVIHKVKAVLGGYSDGPSPSPPAQPGNMHKPAKTTSTKTVSPMAVRQHQQHTSERGLDALDLSLLPDLVAPNQSPQTLALNTGRKSGPSPLNGSKPLPDFHVAISEERLDELITEMQSNG